MSKRSANELVIEAQDFHRQRVRHDGDEPADLIQQVLSSMYKSLEETSDEEDTEHHNNRKTLERAFHAIQSQQQKTLRIEQENKELREKCKAASVQKQSEYQRWSKEKMDLTERLSTLEQHNAKILSQLETSKIQERSKEKLDLTKGLSTLQQNNAKISSRLDAPTTQDWSKEKVALMERLSTLEQLNTKISSQLETAKTHTFVLQGARRASLLPDTVKDIFHQLDDAITNWAQQWVIVPVVDNYEGREAALRFSLQNPKSTETLRTIVKEDPELRRASEKPRTDEDIVTALIWRFLMGRVFEGEMLGLAEATSRIRSLRELEKLMTASALTNREMYTVSVWRSQGINAIVHDPQLSNDRQICIRDLSNQLSDFLEVFMVPNGTDLKEDFVQSLKTTIIEPAVKLHEEMICERDVYRLTFARYLPRIDDPEGATESKSFFLDLPNLECLVVKAKRQIPLERVVHPELGTEELRKGLSKLCTLRPALTRKHISDKDGMGETEILLKQKLLVLWKPDFSGTEGRTFFYELAHPTEVQNLGMV